MNFPADCVDSIRVLVSPKGDIRYGGWDALQLYREVLVVPAVADFIRVNWTRSVEDD